MNTDEHGLNLLTEKIIACAYRVSNKVGCGFLERVYENSMMVALRLAGLRARQQVRFVVVFEGEEVGEYIADIVVEDRVLLELKAVKALDDVHVAQCINLLRASDLPACLLIDFYKPKVEIRRFLAPNVAVGGRSAT